MYDLSRERVFGLEDQIVGADILGDLGDLAFDEVQSRILLAGLVEILEPARRPNVDIEDVDVGFRVL